MEHQKAKTTSSSETTIMALQYVTKVKMSFMRSNQLIYGLWVLFMG